MRIITPVITLAMLILLGGCADVPGQSNMAENSTESAMRHHRDLAMADGSGRMWNRSATEKEAFLGVAVSPADETLRYQLGLPKGTGLVVDGVVPDSPAAKAGVAAHDVVKSLNGTAVTTPEDFVAAVRTLKPGDAVTLSVLHAGKATQIKATLIAEEEPSRRGEMNGWQRGGQWGMGPMGGRGMGPMGGGMGPMNQGPGPMNQWQGNGQRGMGRGGSMGPGPRDGVPTTGPAQRGGGPPMEWNQQQMGRAGGSQNQSSVKVLVSSDKDGSMRFTDIDGQKHLTARDKNGKLLFDGPIDTEEQRKVLPPEVAAKFKKMEASAAP